MINDAHAWYGLPDRGRHLLRCLDKELTDSRDHSHDHSGQLAVILAGREGLLRDMLRTNPALPARFPAVIDFPGFTLTPDATRKAATVLTQAEAGHGSGNARQAARLLHQATAGQARRITTAAQSPDPASLTTIDAADIPEHVHPAVTRSGY